MSDDTDTPIPGNENVIRDQIRAADEVMGEMLIHDACLCRCRAGDEGGASHLRPRQGDDATSKWRHTGEYDSQLISGVKFYTSTVVDGDDMPVAIVYGATRDECRERADNIVRKVGVL